MIKNSYSLIFLALFLAIPMVSLAETVVRTGESVSIESDQVVESDFYAAGKSVMHSGEVKGDMYAVGASVTINGPIGGDLTLFGGAINVNSDVADDVRLISGESIISGNVKGDVFVMGGILKVLSSASIDGNVYFYGGEAEISGPVKGSVMGTAESFRVDSRIDGGVDVVASRGLVLGDRASVEGDIRYQSITEITRAQQAVVNGEVIRNTANSATEKSSNFNVVPAFILIFATLCLFLFFKDGIGKLINDILNLPARATLIGLATFFAGPPAAILMIITVLGSLVGFMLLFGLIVVYLVTLPIMVMVLGGLTMRLTMKDNDLSLITVVVGFVTFAILVMVPVVGPILILGTFILTLGGLAYQGYRTLFLK